MLSNDSTLNASIALEGETTYEASSVTFNPYNPSFLDLNADGQADRTFLCGENVKVYFDAPPADQDPCVGQADVTRLADRPAVPRPVVRRKIASRDGHVFSQMKRILRGRSSKRICSC